MLIKSPADRILFGLKLREQRKLKGYSLVELSEKTGISVSYLNEIEKGKKHPSKGKLEVLIKDLEVDPLKWNQDQTPSNLEPVQALLQSNFLNELPLELFGIDIAKIAELIADAPAKVGAFIATILDISRSHSIQEKSFFIGAMRAYQEILYNYFDEVEKASHSFRDTYLEDTLPTNEKLISILRDLYGIEVSEGVLSSYPNLSTFRAVFDPKKKVVYLNKGLTHVQKRFQLLKEIAFAHLELKERDVTSTLSKVKNFDEVLNHTKAMHFAAGVLLPEAEMKKSLDYIFSENEFPKEAIPQMIERLGVTPEMFFVRLTTLLPKLYDIKSLFFIRLKKVKDKDEFIMDKELHLDRKHYPRGMPKGAQFCRRWLGIKLINNLGSNKFLFDLQKVENVETKERYLEISFARTGNEVSNTGSISATLGVLINTKIEKEIKFLNSDQIPFKIVSHTCESCGIKDCKERVVEAIELERKKYKQDVQDSLNKLLEK
jgi:XRE family transcriptional regulator, fatty acid utilization regulator